MVVSRNWFDKVQKAETAYHLWFGASWSLTLYTFLVSSLSGHNHACLPRKWPRLVQIVTIMCLESHPYRASKQGRCVLSRLSDWCMWMVTLHAIRNMTNHYIFFYKCFRSWEAQRAGCEKGITLHNMAIIWLISSLWRILGDVPEFWKEQVMNISWLATALYQIQNTVQCDKESNLTHWLSHN